MQRDVAAALYSLSIAEENKPAFVEAQALETLIAMAQSKDPDIRRNIAGAMYRLSMCTSIKRPFVELGVLRPLLVLAQGSKDREVQRYSMLAIKELCEKRANHSDIIDAKALPTPSWLSEVQVGTETDDVARALAEVMRDAEGA